MTNREFYLAITKSNLDETLVSKAKEMLVALDTKNAKASAKRLEKSKENEPMLIALVELLGESSLLASDIAKSLDISTSKASALAKKLVDEGRATVSTVKIAKVGTRKMYSLITTESTDNESEDSDE